MKQEPHLPLLGDSVYNGLIAVVGVAVIGLAVWVRHWPVETGPVVDTSHLEESIPSAGDVAVGEPARIAASGPSGLANPAAAPVKPADKTSYPDNPHTLPCCIKEKSRPASTQPDTFNGPPCCVKAAGAPNPTAQRDHSGPANPAAAPIKPDVKARHPVDILPPCCTEQEIRPASTQRDNPNTTPCCVKAAGAPNPTAQRALVTGGSIRTRYEVTAFQKQNGLVADGIIGPTTESAMRAQGYAIDRSLLLQNNTPATIPSETASGKAR